MGWKQRLQSLWQQWRLNTLRRVKGSGQSRARDKRSVGLDCYDRTILCSGYWVKRDFELNTRNIPKGLETTISCLPFELGYSSEAKARGLLHTPEPPQIGGGEGGGGPSQDARKTQALGLNVRSGPAWGKARPVAVEELPHRGQPRPRGLWVCPRALSCGPNLRAPSPPAPAPRPAIQPARPHQVNVGEASEHEVFEELAADAARPHHQDPAPGHGLGQLPGQPPRQCHGGTTTSRGGGGGGRSEPRPEAGGGGAAQLPFLRTSAAYRRRVGGARGCGQAAGPGQGWLWAKDFTPPVVVFLRDAHGSGLRLK